MGVSVLPVSVLTFGVFLKAVAADTGWTRVEISGALTLHMAVSVCAAPLFGWLSDRAPLRRLIAASFCAYGLSVALQGVLPTSLALYYLGFALTGLAGSGASAIVLTKAVASAAGRARGLVFGLTLAGAGLGGAISPLLAQTVIAGWGWRAGFITLGVSSGLIGAISALALIRPDRAPVAAPEGAPADREGLSWAEALRTPTLWLMAGAFAIVGGGFAAVSLSLVPMLTDKGVAPLVAAATQSTVSISVMAGRAVTAFALDRVWAPGLAAALMAFAAVGVGLISHAEPGFALTLGAALLGFSSGAEVDLLAFLTVSNFGLRAYGRIYSLPYGFYLAGAAAGPLLAALVYQATGDYQFGLALFGSSFLLAAAVFVLIRKPATAARIGQAIGLI
jgi:MFS family permease